MKAIIYPRVSSLDQVAGTSLATQEAECRRWCQEHGAHVVAVYLEAGQSAKTADREQLLAALDFVEQARDIDLFVVHKIDRLARQSRDFFNLKARLAAAGCRMVSVMEPLEDSPAGRFMEGVLAMQAQFDNEVRAERCKAGMIESIKRGAWVWMPPLGFLTAKLPDDTATLIHDPVAAPIIRQMFERYATGTITQSALADFAASAGLRTAAGKPLSKQKVSAILANPAYAARIRTRMVKGELPGNWEPIVSRTIFDTVQGILSGCATRGVQRRKLRVEFPLKGYLFCAHCGRKLAGYHASGRGGKKYPYYRCMNCRKQNLSALTMLDEFEALLECLRVPESYFRELRNTVQRELGRSAQRAAELRRAQTEARAKAEREEERLLDLLVRGTITDEAYDRRLRKVRTEAAKIATEHAGYDCELQDIEATISYAHAMLCEPQVFWRKSSDELRLGLLDLWYPSGILFDRNAGLRTMLKQRAPTPSEENAGACTIWYTRADDFAKIMTFLQKVEALRLAAA